MTCTVPTIPAASSAASTKRSPHAALADAPRQNASALGRVMGSMKLTEAPPSTQSINTSLKPWISRSPMVSRHLIWVAPGTLMLELRREGDDLGAHQLD